MIERTLSVGDLAHGASGSGDFRCLSYDHLSVTTLTDQGRGRHTLSIRNLANRGRGSCDFGSLGYNDLSVAAL